MSMRRPVGGALQLVLMSRWPAPGRCKRRLAVEVGARRAAAIQQRLSEHTAAVTRRLCREQGIELVLAICGLGPRAARRWSHLCGMPRVVLQGPGSLGLRLQRQVNRALREGASGLLLIGSDLPDLALTDLEEACRALERHPLVLGPARDGGYWLIGLRRSWRALFSGAPGADAASGGGAIPWGSGEVLARTLAAARASGDGVALVAQRGDLDRPGDLAWWR
ncbi:MAG: TIGR04282 family arsenosugar biosynthesis glycosyltransferase [Synechococcaceae cyanobacterium]|nr:TIGR04282 family arsenosugar biosynthesis glycosyltransferase [Synechococcaceae cyanobacterium]